MKKTKSYLFLIIVCLMILGICSCSRIPEELPKETTVISEKPEPDIKKPDLPVPEPLPVEVPEPEPEPEPEPIIVNPLTGLETKTDYSAKRPIGVMINNISAAQPQLGIGKADIIYELLVEAGITRMFALFQNIEEQDIIGSIRSSRHYYLELVQAYDSIYVHAGGSTYAYEEMSSGDYDHIDGVRGYSSVFYRDDWRRNNLGYEHSMCFTGKALLNYLPESGFRLSHEDGYSVNMHFDDSIPMPGSKNARSGRVTFSSAGKTTTFRYNEQTGQYEPSQYGSAYCDGNTGEQTAFRNVIVLQTSAWGINGDSKGRIDMTLTGSGDGWYMRDGVCIPINWTRDYSNSQFVYTTEDGAEITYGTGKTYVCIISNSGSFSFEN